MNDLPLTRSLRAPGGPCTKSMEVSESRMERVNLGHNPYHIPPFFLGGGGSSIFSDLLFF